MKVMQHQKAAEKNEDPVEAGESQKEQLRLMLDAMWATNALDIQNTVAKACSLVRHKISTANCCVAHTFCPLTKLKAKSKAQPWNKTEA